MILRPLLLLLCVLLPAAPAAKPGVKAQFVGGTPLGLSPKSSARLDLSGTEELTFQCGGTELRIAYKKVNTLEYGQNVNRRWAAAILISPVLLLSKSRKHFVTVGYADPDGKQQVLVFRINKGDIRPVLMSLEARTGRRIEYQDDEARKAVKG
jgi:hypothetical protein